MLESGADHASSTIVWVRDKEIERYSMDYDQMQQWLERMERRIVQWDGVYHPGDHCRYCPRDHECEARTAMAKASIAPFATDAKPQDMTQWSNEKFFDMWNKVSVVLHYARKMDSAMRAHVKKHGPIRLGDQEIVSVEEPRREINAIDAWDTFVQLGLYNEDLSNVLKVRKKELEKAIGGKAKRGQKAAAVREAFSKIEAAGAMTHSTIEKVVSRRIKEKVEDEDANSETEKK
jgi:hypothetical protein